MNPEIEGPDGRALEKVKWPAVALIVTGAIGLALQLLHAARGAGGMSYYGFTPTAKQLQIMNALQGAGWVIIVASLVLSAVVLYGGLQMRRLRSYPLAIAASILAMIPLFGPCCCLGIPVGIWSLVVLNDRIVRASFR